MKLRKIAAMTLLMGMLGTAGASANGVGFVNLNEATRNHPDIQKYDRQVSDIVNKYNPQIQKEVAEAQWRIHGVCRADLPGSRRVACDGGSGQRDT